MKINKSIQLCFPFAISVFFVLFSGSLLAAEKQETFLSSHFLWKSASKDPYALIRKKEHFLLQEGKFTLSGPSNLKQYANSLQTFLKAAALDLETMYGFTPGEQKIFIPLLSQKELAGGYIDLPLESVRPYELIFPLPVDTDASTERVTNSFVVFNLLHALIKADFAFGNRQRLPMSAHAYRFADGLAGFMALQVMQKHFNSEEQQFLHYLDINQMKDYMAHRYSELQILSQNQGAESDSALGGFYQFISGLTLSQDSESGLKKLDLSSPSDRIRVFNLIRDRKGEAGIRRILDYLSRSSQIWDVEDTEDSFCQKFIRIGCEDTTIDGTRADIILQYTMDANFSELLTEVKQTKPAQNISFEEDVPAYPVYGFDFPKMGGANEALVDLHYLREETEVNSFQVVNNQSVTSDGALVGFGIQDEGHQVKFQVQTTSGSKEFEDEIAYQEKDYLVPAILYRNDLRFGIRKIERGYHSGFLSEIGVYFRWNRMKVEWDMATLPDQPRETEYIHRSYFMFELQSFHAWQAKKYFAVGLNLDVDMGGVNHSGSTFVMREEKFNKDSSQFVLGGNIGTEMRFQIPAIFLEVRLGAGVEYLWQPFDDEGGSKTTDNSINATQRSKKLYASIGLRF